ncbi:MAG: sigma-70 family RNA polymerase sigma factor [Saprospiraceae bacterium]
MIISKQICDGFSDLEIIQKSLEEIDFFSCLFERYEEKMLRYIKRVAIVTREEAEDILQESFIKIWKNLHAFDQSLKLSSWIYRIVHNQTISSLRKKKSYGKDQQVELNESLFAEMAEGKEGLSETDLAEREALTERILSQLPLPYKEVLVLKFLENMSYEEISDVLKIPEGTVATRINRAKKGFREISNRQFVSFEI